MEHPGHSRSRCVWCQAGGCFIWPGRWPLARGGPLRKRTIAGSVAFTCWAAVHLAAVPLSCDGEDVE